MYAITCNLSWWLKTSLTLNVDMPDHVCIVSSAREPRLLVKIIAQATAGETPVRLGQLSVTHCQHANERTE